MLPEIGSHLLHPCRSSDSRLLLVFPAFCSSLKVQKEHLFLSVYLKFYAFVFRLPSFPTLPVIVFQSSSMIRFPPTSIALSESDIEFHLREIQLKEQLYAQGFTQKEVQRYYNERYGHANDSDVEDDVLLTLIQGSTCSKAKTKQGQGAESDVPKKNRRKPSGASISNLTPRHFI